MYLDAIGVNFSEEVYPLTYFDITLYTVSSINLISMNDLIIKINDNRLLSCKKTLGGGGVGQGVV